MANPVAEFFGLTDTPPFDPIMIAAIWFAVVVWVAWQTMLLELRERRARRNAHVCVDQPVSQTTDEPLVDSGASEPREKVE